MAPVNWKAWQFLIGDWVGEWTGESGPGRGLVTISPDLQGTILVRRTHVDFSATSGHPAYAHDDLFVIRQDEDGSTLATYFDNDGRVIQSRAENLVAGQPIICLSEVSPAAPRFRFTYLKGPGESVIVRFEIAPPGNPSGFSVHTEGLVHRK
jgi:hypothetical protein